MKLYHGSYTEIENIDFSFCRRNRDFGRAFYVTKYREQAEFWAARKGKDKKCKGVVTEFDFDEDAFEVDELKVLRFEDYSGEWLDFVVMNRKNRKNKPMHDYDIVEGPVADDDIAQRVDNYLRGEITKEQFLIDLTRKPSHQIAFCTTLSLQELELDKYYVDKYVIEIDNNIVKALMTDYGMSDLEATDKYYLSNTYTQLSDESTEFYKKSWQEIYELLKNELKKL